MLIGVFRKRLASARLERAVIAVQGVKRADYIAGAGLRRRSSRYQCT
jgi:hypothetical protein